MVLSIGGTLIGTTTLNPRGPGTNGNEELLHNPHSPEQKSHHWMQVNVILRTSVC